MKKLAANLLWICCLLIVVQTDARDREGYITQFQNIAIDEMIRANVPASIKMAQAILESADGTSYLATNGNNHFGIKCGSRWKGATVYRKDDDRDKNGNLIASCFRKYGSADESFKAHSEFLKDNSRYAFLFQYKKTDYRRWARGLKQAGYATSPTYPEKLIRIIEENNLSRLDNMKPVSPPLATKPTNPTTTSSPGAETGKIFIFNGIKTVKAGKKDSYRSLSKKHNIPVGRLLKYNDLTRMKKIRSGDMIFLQPKRSSFRGNKKTHKVNGTEDMYSISQRYGIKLSSLLKKNKLTASQQPASGELIQLKRKAKSTPQLATKKRAKPKSSVSKKPSIGKQGKSTTGKFHTVQSGETLWGIANTYKISVDHLKQLNQLSDNVIRKGQKLRIK